MCTVTYIPINEEHSVLTSNRDERTSRPTLHPVTEIVGSTEVTFPKDLEAGGTWIAMGNNKRVCCLLNGAFKLHERKPPYKKSRGKVVLEAFQHKSIEDFLQLCKLEEVEPFTLVIFDGNSEKNRLLELRWDATEKHISELNPQKPYIWLSATLYNEETKKFRGDLFENWLAKNKEITPDSAFTFHSEKDNLFTNNKHGLKTVSTTQIKLQSNEFSMKYFDVLQDKTSSLKTQNNA
jgi:uncharacterized protein with NRDE domain